MYPFVPLSSDGDTTSDEEYEVRGDQGPADESDVCSDLDQQELVTEATEEASNQQSDKEEDNSDSDVDVNPLTLVKKKSSTHRILDSDSDDEEVLNPRTDHSPVTFDTSSNSTAPKLDSYHSVPFSECSMSMFDTVTTSITDPVLKETSKKVSIVRTSSLMSQEASMPPLVVTSSSDENSDIEMDFPLPDRQTGNQVLTGPGSTFGLPKDSGLGTMVGARDDSQLTQDTTTCELLPKDSGLGTMVGAREDSQPTLDTTTFGLPKDSGLGTMVGAREDSQLTQDTTTFGLPKDSGLGTMVRAREDTTTSELLLLFTRVRLIGVHACD